MREPVDRGTQSMHRSREERSIRSIKPTGVRYLWSSSEVNHMLLGSFSSAPP